jgi:hypothetical protein
MRYVRAVSALGVLALVLGVGGGGGALAGAQGTEPTDVCTLLTVGEVGKALGQPVGEGTPSARELPGTGGSEEQCTWETQAPNTGILSDTRLQFVVSVQSNCARPDPKGCFRSDKQEAESDHEEKDLKKTGGNEAFYVFTGEVEVLVGQWILNVHFNYFDTNMFSRRTFERRTVDAAKRAVKRL